MLREAAWSVKFGHRRDAKERKRTQKNAKENAELALTKSLQ
jgi:hypothetical protein